MFPGTGSGHKPSAKSGKLQAYASILGSLATIVTSILVLGSILYIFGVFTPIQNAMAPKPALDFNLAPIPVAPVGEQKPPQEVVAANAAATEKQAVAFARSKQKLAVDLGDDVLQMLDQCLAEIQGFEKLTNGLLLNDDGKRIAGDPSLLKRFRLIYSKERPARTRIERYREAVAGMISPVKASFGNAKDTSLPRTEITAELDRIQAEILPVKNAWQRDRDLMEAVVMESKRSSSPASAKPLQETIRLTNEAEDLAFTQAMEKEANKAKSEMEAKLIQAKAEGIRAIEQANIDKHLAEKRAEAERIRTEAFLKEAKEKKEAESAKAKVERERLLAKALDPKTRQMLAPLLAETTFQPFLRDGEVTNDFASRGTGRLSFTSLKSVGALDNTREGLAAMASVGCYVNRHPHWKFSKRPADWTKDTQAFLTEVQALVRELGPILVEEKMLAP